MIGFSLLWWVLLLCSTKSNNNALYFSLVVFLSIVVGFRGIEVCPDTQTYEVIYNSVVVDKDYTYPEPLWVLINFLVYVLGGNFHVLLWISSLITFFCISKVLIKYSPNIIFSLFLLYSLYFIFYSMNITRQMIAVSFVFYAYSKLVEGKRNLFIFYGLIAFLFHYSAIVTFLVLPFLKIQITAKRLYWGIALSLFGGLFFISEGLLSYILGPYAIYLSSSENGFRSSILLPLILSLFLNALCVFIYNTSDDDIKDTLWFKIYILGIIANNLLMGLSLGTRVVMFFSIVQIIILPMYVYNNRLKPKGFALFILLCYVGSLFFMLLFTGSVGVYPYNNVLFDWNLY
ncbi:EpsG family protein [uncultured Phocaeicola sp.]|uniref:EpsG family protein n=1 Tax=uncultured Phocaeicola sp. TaxID=990718 RepID=UPI0025A53F42|nr:EpsG family protein [uncultured Phocaeicola sp.]